jgi:hypothetical protein
MYWNVHSLFIPGADMVLRDGVHDKHMRLVHQRHFPIDHYVLIDEGGDLEPGYLVAEAWHQALHLAAESTGASGNFTLIHNGSGIARRSKPHVHIVCTRTRFQKGLLYILIGIKNLLPLT